MGACSSRPAVVGRGTSGRFRTLRTRCDLRQRITTTPAREGGWSLVGVASGFRRQSLFKLLEQVGSGQCPH